jgi:phosphohistidine swiveling domain-containing protein
MKKELSGRATKLPLRMLKTVVQVRVTEGSGIGSFESSGNSVIANRKGLVRDVLQGAIIISLGTGRRVKILVNGMEGIKRSSEKKNTSEIKLVQAVAKPSKVAEMVGVISQGEGFSRCRAVVGNHKEGGTGG